jgi:uncharacterized protein (DUF849 family)
MGSMNYAKYHEKKKAFVFEFVFSNPFSEIMAIVKAMNEVGTKPEMECFDTGHIGNAYPLIDMGLLQPPYQFSLIMGVLGGIAPTTANLFKMVDMLPPRSDWETIAISHDQWRLIAAAISIGGNIRVGLEDNSTSPRRDGLVQRRPGRQGRAHGARPGARSGDRRTVPRTLAAGAHLIVGKQGRR